MIKPFSDTYMFCRTSMHNINCHQHSTGT
uniref:Uncharacterized protein n=1 Tax=Rhizophora mucronata TaxID=61149 RepID=A0A2P2QU87_RHIMU